MKEVLGVKSMPREFHVGLIRYNPKQRQIIIPVTKFTGMFHSTTRIVRLPANRRRWVVDAPFGLTLRAWKHKAKHQYSNLADFGMTVHVRLTGG